MSRRRSATVIGKADMLALARALAKAGIIPARSAKIQAQANKHHAK